MKDLFSNLDQSKIVRFGNATLLNYDCEEGMRLIPDKYFELAIVDPPYGIGADKGFAGEGIFKGGKPILRRKYIGNWDNTRPTDKYFKDLLRISNKCLIFGGNFFADILPQGTHWIVWDKLNTMPTYSDCELIWTNVKRNSVSKYTFRWNGLMTYDKINTPIGKPERIHPTQKPVSIYQWLLKNYAKPGDKILDTHGGSMSLGVACLSLGFECVVFELDKNYFQLGVQRIKPIPQKIDGKSSITKYL